MQSHPDARQINLYELMIMPSGVNCAQNVYIIVSTKGNFITSAENRSLLVRIYFELINPLLRH